jgi:hypothetical protein
MKLLWIMSVGFDVTTIVIYWTTSWITFKENISYS